MPKKTFIIDSQMTQGFDTVSAADPEDALRAFYRKFPPCPEEGEPPVEAYERTTVNAAWDFRIYCKGDRGAAVYMVAHHHLRAPGVGVLVDLSQD